jgi:ribokinase
VVLVFGSINIDLVSRVERFPDPGETVSGSSFAVYPGGKGANQALASARAGAPTRLAGAVGRDAFAAAALALVGEGAVDLAYVARVDHATGCATILVSDTGENVIVSVPGANAYADPATIPDAILTRSSTVSVQQELPAAANQALVERARRNGSRVVLNASPWRSLPLETLRAVHLLIVNEHEAAALAAAFGWPTTPHDLALAATGVVEDLTLVITLGKHGALAARRGTMLRVSAPAVHATDTTGAGDAFAGTFIAALDGDASLAEALRRSVTAGSLACTAAGAQPSFPERSAVDSVLERIGSPPPQLLR